MDRKEFFRQGFLGLKKTLKQVDKIKEEAVSLASENLKKENEEEILSRSEPEITKSRPVRKGLKFPPGAVQFEVGIQTFDEKTSNNISRRQNLVKLEDNFRFLREETGVHIHADLIVGLPGETLESFGQGFDRLVRLGPQEIQVGILKRLRGTPIARHDDEYRMIYAPWPPYEILSTRDISFADMQRMRRFARYWDLVANSGHFATTLRLLWGDGASPFVEFLRFSDWVHAKLRRTHQIALHIMAQALFDFLTQVKAVDAALTADTLEGDWHRTPSR
ncbi:MAG TPA: DUF4080 domain-containing protein, partial [Leptospiraceae bacterium]|nr:DUF4080 domain-containing protein [Leptospiraceae bacterium]